LINVKKNPNCLYVPALFEISREGHNWVNSKERYSSFYTLNMWITYDSLITMKHIDNTVEIKTKETQVEYKFKNDSKEEHDLIGFEATIKSSNIFGSICTNVTVSDLKRLGITMNHYFEIEFLGKQTEKKKIYFGCYPFFVEKMTWICFENPEGYVDISVNTFEHRNVMKDNNLVLGDQIFVHSNLIQFNLKKKKEIEK